MKTYLPKTLTINTYYCNKIEVYGHYSIGLIGDRDTPDDPNEFVIDTIQESIDNYFAVTDKFDEDYVLQVCLGMCEADQDSIELNEHDSKIIMNTEKYLSANEIEMLELLLQSEYGRMGNSQTKKNMIESIAKKCVLAGLDKDFHKNM